MNRVFTAKASRATPVREAIRSMATTEQADANAARFERQAEYHEAEALRCRRAAENWQRMAAARRGAP